MPKSILSKYERILSRNTSNVLYPLRGQACGHCDTAIPMQRRNAIAGRSRDRCLRGVRSAPVRGRMMVVAPLRGR